MIRLDRKSFLLRGSVENGNKKLVKIQVLKIALLKIVVWVPMLDWATGNEKWIPILVSPWTRNRK